MTMAHERTRSVVQTRDFLQELARDTSLPECVRNQAKNLYYGTTRQQKPSCWLVEWKSGPSRNFLY